MDQYAAPVSGAAPCGQGSTEVKNSWAEQVSGSSTIRSDSRVDPQRPLLMMMDLSMMGAPFPAADRRCGHVVQPCGDVPADLRAAVDEHGVPGTLQHDGAGLWKQSFGLPGQVPGPGIAAVE